MREVQEEVKEEEEGEGEGEEAEEAEGQEAEGEEEEGEVGVAKAVGEERVGKREGRVVYPPPLRPAHRREVHRRRSAS